MIRQDVLSPIESGEFIAKRSDHVKIHEEGIEKFCLEMMASISDRLQIPDTGADAIHPSPDHPNAVDWVFVADALNFCFWSKAGQDKWTVDGHSGYFALEAALARAIKEGHDITSPTYYSNITEDQLSHIMRGDNAAKIPLFEKRLSILHEEGKILLKKYSGTFQTCLKEADKSAVKLLNILVENFPSFRDEATFKGKQVSLYKRAQILVADLWNFFGGKGWGEFGDIEQLTMFADYRIPQVLVYFGAMSYSEELMKKLENDILLPSGSEVEVEIRGCSIHTVQLLKKRIEEKLRHTNSTADVPNSVQIDYYLWCYRRKYADQLEKIPFHKTLGIFY
ncbi:hypothetical protein O0L34_g14831 [Tuta absoluta]|nr:hypothetical protein O0L34_g14831 [Tuta absoluta]